MFSWQIDSLISMSCNGLVDIGHNWQFMQKSFHFTISNATIWCTWMTESLTMSIWKKHRFNHWDQYEYILSMVSYFSCVCYVLFLISYNLSRNWRGYFTVCIAIFLKQMRAHSIWTFIVFVNVHKAIILLRMLIHLISLHLLFVVLTLSLIFHFPRRSLLMQGSNCSIQHCNTNHHLCLHLHMNIPVFHSALHRAHSF